MSYSFVIIDYAAKLRQIFNLTKKSRKNFQALENIVCIITVNQLFSIFFYTKKTIFESILFLY